MSVRPIQNVARLASRFSNSVRHASVSAEPVEESHDTAPPPPVERKKRGQMRKEHGSNIYVYSHLQTKQVVYSLTPGVNNNAALRQLPYNGKKTVPRALRKDLWHPMAQITFSSAIPEAPTLGLSTFKYMREYRKLHETLWPVEEMKGLTRKQRGRKLCDQRANSVADMAAALAKALPKEEEKATDKDGKAQDVESKQGSDKEGDAEVVATVKWANLLDAEFAEQWPKGIVHDVWETLRNNRKEPEYTPGRLTQDEIRTSEESTRDTTGRVVL